jgi:hypothetical protein
MVDKINVEEFYLLRHNAVYPVESQRTLRRNMSPPSSELKYKPSKFCLPSGFTLVFCLAYSSTLKMMTCCSETSIYFRRTIRCYIPEDRTLHNHCFENLKCYKIIVTYIVK